MIDRTELRIAYESALARHRYTQLEFASKTNTNSSIYYKCVTGKMRHINDDTLRNLATKWPDPETGIIIMEAYLKTELRRAGLSSDTIAITTTRPDTNADIAQAVATINYHLHHDADLADILLHIADTLRTNQEALAAEPHTKYGKK